MKHFAITMSLYMLFLACLPCGDTRACNRGMGDVKMSACSNEKDQDHTTDGCSPFCYCSCCTSSACFIQFPAIQTLKSEHQSAPATYYVAFLSYEVHSIWQPPKLG